MRTAMGLINHRKPLVELMLIIVSVLVLATPLPRCNLPPDWAKNPEYKILGRARVPYAEHGSTNTDKNVWAATLATKMMWYLFLDILQSEPKSGCSPSTFSNKSGILEPKFFITPITYSNIL